MQASEDAGLAKRTRLMRRCAVALWVSAPAVALSAVIVSAFGFSIPELIRLLINCIAAAGSAAGFGLWYRSDPVFDAKRSREQP